MFDPLIGADIRRQWAGPSTQRGSRILADRNINFTDANLALAFDRTVEVARENPWPFDEVWASVEKHWGHRYKEELARSRESESAPVKARARAPKVDEIKHWYLGDHTPKLRG